MSLTKKSEHFLLNKTNKFHQTMKYILTTTNWHRGIRLLYAANIITPFRPAVIWEKPWWDLRNAKLHEPTKTQPETCWLATNAALACWVHTDAMKGKDMDLHVSTHDTSMRFVDLPIFPWIRHGLKDIALITI